MLQIEAMVSSSAGRRVVVWGTGLCRRGEFIDGEDI